LECMACNHHPRNRPAAETVLLRPAPCGACSSG
jgi:hypothetical protein